MRWLPDGAGAGRRLREAAWLSRRRRDRGCCRSPRRRGARESDAADALPCARHGAAARRAGSSRRSICSSCSPSCVRRGSACRRRAASPRRSACRRRATASPTQALALIDAARALLARARSSRRRQRSARHRRWRWSAAAGAGAPAVLAALRATRPSAAARPASRVWRKLAGMGRSTRRRRRPAITRSRRARRARRLAELLGAGAEARPQQADYAAAVSAAFRPRDARGRAARSCWPRPAPASARRWAISRRPACGPRRTAARCGSRPTPATCSARSTASSTGSTPIRREKRRRVVVRKGRENYLCLLNYEEARRGAAAARPRTRSALGLHGALDRRRRATATWSAAISRAGCPTLIGRGRVARPRRPARRVHPFGLPALPPLLRREEHPPRAARRHRRRQPRAGDGAGGARRARRRDAADALRVRRGPSPVRRRRRRLSLRALAAGGGRAAALAARRRGRRGRAARAGCERRIGDLVGERRGAAERRCVEALVAARVAARRGLAAAPRRRHGRIGPTEAFLALVRAAGAGARARATTAATASSRGAAAARRADRGGATRSPRRSTRIAAPMRGAGQRLRAGSRTSADELDTGTRARIEAMVRGLDAAARSSSAAGARMLRDLASRADAEFVDWFASTASTGARSMSACTATGSTRREPFAERGGASRRTASSSPRRR